MRSVVVLVLFACSASPDAVPDASRSHPGSDCVWIGTEYRETATCQSGTASTLMERRSNGGTSHSMCYEATPHAATCASGCAVEATLVNDWLPPTLPPTIELYFLSAAPQVLCAETPEAHAGDPCDLIGTKPCWPTRAHVDANGIVTGQDYLQCTNGACAPAPAPTAYNYLRPCSPPAEYLTPGTKGFVSVAGTRTMCLIAWDEQAQAAVTGGSISCIGDWQCPVGALCDDTLTFLAEPTTHIAVCKPGPRGVLTPAMLSP